MIDVINGSCSPNVRKKKGTKKRNDECRKQVFTIYSLADVSGAWRMHTPHTGEILNLQLLFYILKWKIVIIVNHCYLMCAIFSTHRDDDVTNWPPCNGIIGWCAEGHCDVQNAVCAAEKNTPNVFPVCQDHADISKIHLANKWVPQEISIPWIKKLSTFSLL